MNEMIAENDPAVDSRDVVIERDGGSMAAFVASPSGASPDTPGVVLAMHVYGVDADQRDVARRFAKEGFVAIVPDLYARLGAPDAAVETDYRAFIPFARQLTFESVDADVRAAARWLHGAFPQTRLAIAGFCMGGVMATRRSTGHSSLFGAVSAWYGISSDVRPEDVDVPIVASYGANDASIPVETVEAFFSAVPVEHDVKIYPNAGHAFFDRTRPAFEPAAAEDSWKRSIAFLRKHLADQRS